MAAIVTVYSSGKPVDLFYVVKEPKFEETINCYLASNGCSASYVYVSKDPSASKFKMDNIYSKLPSDLKNIQKPSYAMSLIELLQEMMNRDYISTVCLTPEDRRKIKAKQSIIEPPDTTTTARPASPMFDSSFDDDMIMEISRMEASRNEIDTSLCNIPILDAIKQLSDKMETQMNLSRELVKCVQGINQDVKDLKDCQSKQEVKVSLILKSVNLIQSDPSDTLCVYCAEGEHAEENCIWSLLKCSVCQGLGHNPMVHKASNSKLRSRIMNTHGVDLSFFSK